MTSIGLRVDVDFGIGLRRGVPYLLDVFRERQLQVTFYVTMGPDGFRRHTQRLGSRKYRARVRRMSPWSILTKFGPIYLLRQAAGIPSDVGRRYPAVLRRTLDEGHEVGVHGYDHYWWAEHVFTADRAALKQDMDRALRTFRDCTGREAMAWASPNWRCSAESLALVDDYGFPYGADTRGAAPFVPDAGAGPARAPQLPISLPCLHEIADYLDTTEAEPIVGEFGSHVTAGYNVWCIHDYYEGVLRRDLFERALDAVAGRPIVSIATLARHFERSALPVCRVLPGRVAGGRGEVSCRGDELTVTKAVQ